MPFRVTYARWLNTHDRSHRGYNKRKSFPWHIISKVDFSPNPFQGNIVVYNKESVLLGYVCVDDYELRGDDQRHQFDVTVDDVRAGKIHCFRIVFSYEGVLITIHPLGQDKDARIVRRFLVGRYDSYDENPTKRLAKSIVKEAAERLLRSIGQMDRYESSKPYPGIDIDSICIEEAKQVNRKLKQRMTYTVDLSQERDIWIVFTLFRYEAHSVTYKYAHQCSELVSVYLSDTKKVQYPNVFSNAKVVSIYEYFDWSAQPNIRMHLEELQNRILLFSKYA